MHQVRPSRPLAGCMGGEREREREREKDNKNEARRLQSVPSASSV